MVFSPECKRLFVSERLLLRWPAHLKEVSGAAVVVAAETGNGPKLARIDLAAGVEHGVIDVNQQDFADHEICGGRSLADGHDLQEHAFEVRGRSP